MMTQWDLYKCESSVGVCCQDVEKELVEAWKKMGANRASEPEQPTPVVTPQKAREGRIYLGGGVCPLCPAGAF